MEIRQLEYFLAVVADGNFTRAAARLHVAQPGVSAQIHRLEHELGHELLDRSGRSVTPTAAGDALLPHAEAALTALRDAKRAVDQVAGLLRGQVRVGMVTMVASMDVPGLLEDFQSDHPGLEITLTEGATDNLVAELRGSQLDMAFLGFSAAPPSFLQTELVIDDPLVAVLPPGNGLADHESVTLRDLASLRLMSLPDGTATRQRLDLALATAGIVAPITFSASDPRVLVQMASRGFGTAIVPLGVVQSPGELRVLPLSDPGMHAWICLAWCRDRAADPAAQAVVQHALDRIKNRDGHPRRDRA